MDEGGLKKLSPSRRWQNDETASAPIEGSGSALIEHVLEHISSQFRWELLDDKISKNVPLSTDDRGSSKLR